MAETSLQAVDFVRKRLEQDGSDLLKNLLQMMVEQLMSSEASSLCGAGYGERSESRVNTRNGYRNRDWDTRMGTVDLRVPKLRVGSYFPNWLLEPRRRAEQALVSVVAECYVAGVSTRRVENIAQALGIHQLSRSQVSELAKSLDDSVREFRTRPLDRDGYPYVWMDALAMKVREGGCVVSVAVVVATGVRSDGHREILGVDVVTSEDGAGWMSFLDGLLARGLSGVRLVISDAHRGLKEAISSKLPGVSWQRCRTHFMRNILCKVRKSAQNLVATTVRTIFEQPDSDAVDAQFRRTVSQIRRAGFNEAADLLEDARDDILAFSKYPTEHWKHIWSNNPQERLNKEIRRRTDVVGIFPNRDSILRLVGSVLAEMNDEWIVAHRYLGVESLEKLKPAKITELQTRAIKSKGVKRALPLAA